PFFGRYRELLEPIYRQQWELVHDLSVHALELFLSALGIRTPLVRSSTLGVSGSGTELLANICAKLRATAYLSGDYAAGNHLDIRVFKERGIGVQVQGWQCQEYRQQHLQAGFVPDLSIADLLFNEGEGSLGVLRRCRRQGFSLDSIYSNQGDNIFDLPRVRVPNLGNRLNIRLVVALDVVTEGLNDR